MKPKFVIILSVCIALLVTVFRMDAAASGQRGGLSVTKEKISKAFKVKLNRDVYICHSLVAKVNTGKTTSAGVGRETNYHFQSSNIASNVPVLLSCKSTQVEQRLYLLNCAHLL